MGEGEERRLRRSPGRMRMPRAAGVCPCHVQPALDRVFEGEVGSSPRHGRAVSRTGADAFYHAADGAAAAGDIRSAFRKIKKRVILLPTIVIT